MERDKDMNKILISLDGSGSMSSRRGYTVKAINEYIDELKSKELGETKLELFIWSDERYVSLYKGTVDGFPGMDRDDYHCGGMTPLYDSIARGITNLIASKKGKRLLVVMTDGGENSSRKYTKPYLKGMIEAFRANGNEIIFLGNDIDVTEEGADLGTKSNYTISYRSVDSSAVYKNEVSNITSSYFAGTDEAVNVYKDRLIPASKVSGSTNENDGTL